jgi:hypothetical protein
MQKDMLKEEALKSRAWFQKGQKNWSAAHHTTISTIAAPPIDHLTKVKLQK